MIPALASHVVGTDHRTVLASGSDTVSTVEHVLAAATAMGVDDVSIETCGPELPIGDGSAAHFVDLFERAGRIANTAELAPLIVREPFQLTHEGSHYAVEMQQRNDEGGALLRIEASFRTTFGSHLRREIVLWQRITQPKGLLGLLTREVPAKYKKAGLWMHDALELRDRWESKLLRTSRWSPLS